MIEYLKCLSRSILSIWHENAYLFDLTDKITIIQQLFKMELLKSRCMVKGSYHTVKKGLLKHPWICCLTKPRCLWKILSFI